MSLFILRDGAIYQTLSTANNCGLTETQILEKDVPEGYTAKKTTIESVNSTPLAELWNSL